MRSDRVKHIIAKRLDDPEEAGPIYVETLCGRILKHIGFFSGEQRAQGHGYLSWDDDADCQDCLRKHFRMPTR